LQAEVSLSPSACCNRHVSNLFIDFPLPALELTCRERLSYEQFSFFLQNIKELNAGRQVSMNDIDKEYCAQKARS